MSDKKSKVANDSSYVFLSPSECQFYIQNCVEYITNYFNSLVDEFRVNNKSPYQLRDIFLNVYIELGDLLIREIVANTPIGHVEVIQFLMAALQRESGTDPILNKAKFDAEKNTIN